MAALRKQRQMAFEQHSRLTVLSGRRRIGKTLLLNNALNDGEGYLYLFVSRSSEAMLCQSFVKEINSFTGDFVPQMTSFADVFRYLLNLGKSRHFSLVIDEFQDFEYVNPAVFGIIQDYWDRYRTESHVNFVVSGSAYSMMKRIFTDRKEPLYGRADKIMHINAFPTTVLRQILADYSPGYSNDELLALYTFTGGVPKYVELMMDEGAFTIDAMIDNICQQDSPFIEEGRTMLVQEFGRKYGIYFSIIQAIANGFNTLPKIEAIMGGVSVGGYLKNLEEVYSLITKCRPIMSKPGSQAVRYEVSDLFLRFWFRYVDSNRSMMEIGNYKGLAEIVKADYATYSGKVLEQYFRQKMAESMEYRAIGSWWEPKDSQNEIDIVALRLERNHAVAAEVKRRKKNYKPELMQAKVEIMRSKILPRYHIDIRCLDINDM